MNPQNRLSPFLMQAPGYERLSVAYMVQMKADKRKEAICSLEENNTSMARPKFPRGFT